MSLIITFDVQRGRQTSASAALTAYATRSVRIWHMRGAPAKAIQELAGHQDLITTQQYMHLSPAAIESAIRLLEQPDPAVAWRNAGDDRAANQ